MTEDRATAPDGARIAFDVQGSGEPLVLLAGQANSRHWWDPVRADLSGSFATIAIDALGTGASDTPGHAEWGTRRFARDVVAVLDELGIARAHVYGTSMGGRVAQWVAVDTPERVGALVLGCTTGGGAGGVPADPDVLRPLAADPDTARQALTDLMVGPHWRRAHPGPLSVLGDDTMTARARREHRRASARHDAWDVLPGVTAPTLVLHGTDDAFAPVRNGTLLAERIPGAILHLFEGARHAYFLERRGEASAVVLDFLDAHPLRDRPRP
ncbi:alpha/beta fold hydrolase [Pseudonocardia sp. KRD291]|uniref:alpha/beta fold hydrolase n=1 Tax=Pseudonocardia sp. KRD291 TaxID=2792007 RepID=UPI001C4A3B7C|nr:alpha/beta fold hydrolase [Pseudonocardia sp. KRD291]MBW0101903.1 alpha/beta fold hydrolase [Pseudonocardia sp. KRD291]